MSYNPITWGNIVNDIGDTFSAGHSVDLGITRAGHTISSNNTVYSPFAKIGEFATAAVSVAQLAASNPYLAGAALTLYGGKQIYDGLKEIF